MKINKSFHGYTPLTAPLVSFIILLTAFLLIGANEAHSEALPGEKRALKRAVDVYNSGNFLIALKRFQGFIKNFPDSESAVKVKLHIASCHEKSGELDNAVRTYISIIENRCDKEDILSAAVSLGKTNNKIARKYLEEKLLTRNIPVRAAVAEALGIIGNNSTANKMMTVLKNEREKNIQEKLLSSITNIKGMGISVRSLTSLFKKGGEDLKISIVKILSLMKKNSVIKFLRKQLGTSSARLKPYIIWALARIDPYLYGVRLEGTIRKEEDSSWWLVQDKTGKKYELKKPDINEPIPDKELKEFNDKKVILFGGNYQDRILYLYNDIYLK